MKVLYVWDSEYPWDVRTEKVCLALAGAGHRVTITARNLRARPRTEELREGTVERLRPGPKLGRRWASFPAFINPVWIAHVLRLHREHSFDVIIVRDLPLAPVALFAARGRTPVILDMAENYPAMIHDVWADGRARASDILVRNPHLARMVERFVVKRVRHVVVVVEESKDRVAALGVPEGRISVVSNTPSRERVTRGGVASSTGRLRAVYLGLMERHRGVGTVLEAVAALKGKGVQLQLDLVGDGRDFEDFRRLAAELELSEADAIFHGRLDHSEAIAVVGKADVGLVPHEARESWNTTIPNKLFDYMAAGLTVITSDAAPAARVVRSTGAGLVFRSGDVEDLAQQLYRSQDQEMRAKCGKAGRAAVATQYNWENDSRTLLEVVSQVGNGAAGPPTDR